IASARGACTSVRANGSWFPGRLTWPAARRRKFVIGGIPFTLRVTFGAIPLASTLVSVAQESARRTAAPRNRDRASARSNPVIGPYPCCHAGSALPRRRRCWRTGGVGRSRRKDDRRPALVDRSVEDCARQ